VSALRFLHRHVLDVPAPVAKIPRPKRKKSLPKVLSESEVKDIDAERGQIHVRQGKGRKDRYVMLSPVVLEVLREYVRVE